MDRGSRLSGGVVLVLACKVFMRGCRTSIVRPAIAACLLFSRLLLPQASHKIYSAKGRTISYTVLLFAPSAQISPDNGPLNQDSAINCVRLYWSRLKKLDIEGAAQLYSDPQREIDLRTKYRQRVGDEVFRDMQSKIFDSNRFAYELVIGTEHALVSESRPGTLLLFRVRDGKFFLEAADLKQLTQDAQDLATLVNAYGDGQLKFQ
jgi:hypothetical protein